MKHSRTKDCEEKIHLFYGVIITQFMSGLLTDYLALLVAEMSSLNFWPYEDKVSPIGWNKYW